MLRMVKVGWLQEALEGVHQVCVCPAEKIFNRHEILTDNPAIHDDAKMLHTLIVNRFLTDLQTQQVVGPVKLVVGYPLDVVEFSLRKTARPIDVHREVSLKRERLIIGRIDFKPINLSGPEIVVGFVNLGTGVNSMH